MYSFPVVSWNHLNCVPGTSVQERAVWPFTNTLLTTDAEIRIDFNPSERWVVFIGNPKHASFNRTILDARR